jgi:hypothetical protein
MSVSSHVGAWLVTQSGTQSVATTIGKNRSSLASHVGRIEFKFVSFNVEVVNFEHLCNKSPSRAALNLDDYV